MVAIVRQYQTTFLMICLWKKGYISSYDFNIGTSFSDIVSVGATISMTDINYRLYSQYTEYMPDGNGALADNRRFDLYNWNRTDGYELASKSGSYNKTGSRIPYRYCLPLANMV